MPSARAVRDCSGAAAARDTEDRGLPLVPLAQLVQAFAAELFALAAA
jgi:hypothetical protein